MPNRPLIALLVAFFCLPSLAFAECGLANDEEGMTVVVGKTSNKCFQSETFRAAFRVRLLASVAEMEAQAAAERRDKRPAAPRPQNAQQPWLLDNGAAQPAQQGGYYGQK